PALHHARRRALLLLPSGRRADRPAFVFRDVPLTTSRTICTCTATANCLVCDVDASVVASSRARGRLLRRRGFARGGRTVRRRREERRRGRGRLGSRRRGGRQRRR